MKEMKSKEEFLQKVTENLKELNDLNNTEVLIKDNKIAFEVKKEEYRICKPNYKQKNDLIKARSKKYIEFLKDDIFLLREQLVAIYKEKGIDLDKINIEVKQIHNNIEKLQVILAPEKDKNSRNRIKKEIEKLFREQAELIEKKSDYLALCLETELLEFDNLYTIFLILEKKVEDKWVDAFDDYDKFLESDDTVINKALMNLPYLIFNPGLSEE